MNLEALRTSLFARGFDYLTAAEANDYLNDSYLLDICEEEDWPFLEASKEGVTPLEISDLRTIEYVENATQTEKLYPMLRARITDGWSPALSQTGTPELYYITEGKNVNVFPVSTTDVISVRYWKVAPRLSGTATPLLPERWHSLIVDGAVARAYAKTADWELRGVAEANFEAHLQKMRESLMNMQHDASNDFVVLEDPGRMR